MKKLLILLLATMSLAAEEPPKLKATDELTAKVPVSFNDLRYAKLTLDIKECRQIKVLKPIPFVKFRIFILATGRHFLNVRYEGMTIHESHGVIMPKNVVKDACEAVMGIAETCEDCWAYYDRNGKPVKPGGPPPNADKAPE